MKILERFDDPETERAFVETERAERGQAIRALVAISIATLISYIFLNPHHFPPAGVIAYQQAAGVLIVLMIGLFVLTRTRFYLENAWIDLPVFIAMAAGMKYLALVLADLSPITGIPPHAMAAIQMAILVIFASVGFAATFRLFVVWATIVLALFAAWLMTRPGIPDINKALEDGYTTGGGLGLGLSGAKRLSNEFHIDSTPGKGTTITLIRWK